MAKDRDDHRAFCKAMQLETAIGRSPFGIIFNPGCDLLGLDMGEQGPPPLCGTDDNEAGWLTVTHRWCPGGLREEPAEHVFRERIAAKRANIAAPSK